MTVDGSVQLPTKQGGLSGGALKTIAIIAMVIDHTAYAFVPDYYGPLGAALHFIGRITGPIMFFFIAQGYHYTSNKNRYTLRLAIFAAVSWLPYVWFITGGPPGSGTWWRMSVIYTLLLGHLALRALHEVRNPVLKWVLAAACFFASGIGDWAYTGVLIVVLFDLLRDNFRYQALAYSLLVVLRALPAFFSALSMAGMGLSSAYQLAQVFVTLGMLLPLLLLRFYNGRRGKGSKWFFYIFYPAHLAVIVLIKVLV